MENEFISENQLQNDVRFPDNSKEFVNISNDTEMQMIKQKISQQFTNNKGSYLLKPNWPNFFPILHYDIREISFQYHYLLKKGYICWKFFFITLILNSVCSIITLDTPKLVNLYDPNPLISFFYALILPIISFDLVNVSIYEMFLVPYDIVIHRKTLILIFINGALAFFLSLGIRYSGSNGIIILIDFCLEKKFFEAFLTSIITFTFLITFLLYFQLFINIFFAHSETNLP